MIDLAVVDETFSDLKAHTDMIKKAKLEKELKELIFLGLIGLLPFDKKQRKKDLETYIKLYHSLFVDTKQVNAWNLERLNSAWHNHLLEQDQLNDLFNISKYLPFAMDWLADNSPLYIQPITCECLELYYIRLFRQFKGLAEYQFLIDLAKYYPNAKVSSNQLFDTMYAIDFVLSLTTTNKGNRETYLSYVHIAQAGQEDSIEKKKQGTGAYRFSDGKRFISDQQARQAIKDKPSHKSIFFTIEKDGFVFDKSQFENLFDTSILFSGLNDLISDHRKKSFKINTRDKEKIVRDWQSVADVAERLTQ